MTSAMREDRANPEAAAADDIWNEPVWGLKPCVALSMVLNNSSFQSCVKDTLGGHLSATLLVTDGHILVPYRCLARFICLPKAASYLNDAVRREGH